jgi:hypothetical protein
LQQLHDKKFKRRRRRRYKTAAFLGLAESIYSLYPN